MKKLCLAFLFVCSLPAQAVEIPDGDYEGREDVGAFVKRIARAV